MNMNMEDENTNAFIQNLKEIYDDFQTLQPYAKYQPKLIPKITKQTVIDSSLNVDQTQSEKDKKRNAKGNEKKISCDLVIVLDCTGSMMSWITQCKQYILTIIDGVKSEFKQSQVRVAFIAYRDIGDSDRFQTFDFINKDYEKLEQFIGSLIATGGGDLPEDLAGGLNQAMNLNWQSNYKHLFMITDAPCHGEKYHCVSDSYPNGCPNGIDIENLFIQMALKNIDVTAIDINSTTDKMYEIFNRVYQKASKKPITRLQIGDSYNTSLDKSSGIKDKKQSNDFGSSITRTVISSITGCSTSLKTKNISKEYAEEDGKQAEDNKVWQQALRILQQNKGLLNTRCLSVTEIENSAFDQSQTKKNMTKYTAKAKEILEEEESGNEESDSEEEQEEQKLDQKNVESISKIEQQRILSSKYLPTCMDELSKWYDNMKSQDVFTLTCTCYTPYVDKSSQIDWRKPIVKFNKLSSKIKVYKKYFSEGAMRYAFYAYDSVLNQKLVAKLHKNMKDNSNFELMKRDCMSLIACHYFAEEFNSRILITSKHSEETPNLLNFVDSTIYEVQKHFNNDIKFYFVENYIEGQYQKYNNNAGWTYESSSSEFNQISQAFSHFTWQYSKGQLLVVDIQGGELGILTDPQIHTKNRSRLYGLGDLGYEGMLKFFYTHHCNHYCKQLGLIHPIVTSSIPNNFDFFSDLFGLENMVGGEKEEEKEEQRIKDVKLSELATVNTNEEVVNNKETEEILEELVNKKQEMNDKQNQSKNKKKKRGQALKNEYEKLRVQKEQEEQKQAEEEKMRQEQVALKLEKEAEEKAKEEAKARLNPQVGTQCNFCKTCFQVDRKKIVQNKLCKKETLCQQCEYECHISLIDISCSKCKCQFQSSKYFFKMKRQNIVGECDKCRE